MTRRSWAIAGVAVIAVLVFLSVLSNRGAKTPTSDITQKLSVPSTFAAAAAYNQDSLVSSDGQRLVEYNYVSGKSTPLSSSTGGVGLIDTLSVSADKQYLLFHSALAAQGTTLYQRLSDLGLEPTADYWWIFNIPQRQFTPLPQGILLAKLDGGHAYGMIYTPDGEHINTYDPNTGAQTASIPVAPSSNFFVAKNGFLLESSGGDISQTKDGVVIQQVAKAMNLVGVTADKKWALATKTIKGLVQLERINLQDNTTKTIATDVVGTPAWLSQTQLLFGTNDQQAAATSTMQLYTYDVTADKLRGWKLAKNIALDGSSNPSPVAFVGNTTAVLTDGSSKYYLIGNNLHKIEL